MVADGFKVEDVVYWVGSYARFDWAVQHRSYLDDEFWVRNICELWSSSDPDDTNLQFLELFRQARAKASVTLHDEPKKTLPGLGSEHIWLYRGQRATDPIGIS